MNGSELLAKSNRELKALLESGHPIDPRQLDDSEYCGVSLGLPSFVEQLTWKKFTKVFHRDPVRGVLRGWNVRVEQNGLDAPWRARLRDGAPVTFGHYQVVQADEARVPDGCAAGLLIDYGRGGNARLDVVGRLRDPIVALKRGSAELLLGWTYVDLGVGHLPTPSFFSLQRGAPLSHRVEPPRG